MNLTSPLSRPRESARFDQFCAAPLFDDQNCGEPNGCSSDADPRAVRTVRLMGSDPLSALNRSRDHGIGSRAASRSKKKERPRLIESRTLS
jgi:hypothetical protein